VDGSERRAPTCDDLLANVLNEGEKALNHLRVARQALVRGDFDGSQRGFCRAIRAGQADAITASELAQVLILRRDAVAAIPWAQETVRLDPGSPRALTLLGDALIRAGNLEEARRAWLGASKIAEDDHSGIDHMGSASRSPTSRSVSASSGGVE
jgi:Flp pilus assembly protein TadD